MKIKYIQTLLILSFSLSLTAQEKVSNTTMMIDESSVPSLRIEEALPMDESRDYFEEFMKEKYDVKVMGNGLFSANKRMTIEQVSMSSLHENELDMLIDFEEMGTNHSVMTLAARNGYDLYFSREYAPESSEGVKDLLSAYEENAIDEHYKAKLETQQKRMAKTRKSLKRNERRIERNENDIAANLKDNEKLRKENEELREDVESTRKKLSDAKVQLERTKTILEK